MMLDIIQMALGRNKFSTLGLQPWVCGSLTVLAPGSEPSGWQSEKLAQSQYILSLESLACVTECPPAQLPAPGYSGIEW